MTHERIFNPHRPRREAKMKKDNNDQPSPAQEELPQEGEKKQLIEKTMKNLNKQNMFTEEWKATFPKGSALFCKWIDEYKNSVNWNDLFTYAGGQSTKFHDIPIEMRKRRLSSF